MKLFVLFLASLVIPSLIIAQGIDLPCSHEAIVNRNLESNPNFEDEIEQTEQELQKIINELRAQNVSGTRNDESYIIPVVMHVFHHGDDGKMDMEQALSGLELLNNDFQGFNDGWESIDSEFDSIKGALDITFCLATIDPFGDPTTGVVYYDDEDALTNDADLFIHAWDNFKYLNIYLPKYVYGGPSDFTAWAYYPSLANTQTNTDGIFYSSIRWGYGNHSILEEADDWASVGAHEAGHWLNLRHTFEGNCGTTGDLVSDTPPTQGSGIELEGCYNNDFSCGERTNGENFMDYNHRCKKMFTQGQVDRMEAALFLSSRENLWTVENLEATGCMKLDIDVEESILASISIYPNPASTSVAVTFEMESTTIEISNIHGQVVDQFHAFTSGNEIDISEYSTGMYFITLINDDQRFTKKLLVRK